MTRWLQYQERYGGARILEGGGPAAFARIVSKADIITNGINAARGALFGDIFGLLPLSIFPRNSISNGYEFFTTIIPSPLRPLIENLLLEAFVPQLSDMVPGSSYMTNNVVSLDVELVKLHVGDKTVVVVEPIPDFPFFVIIEKTVPIYKYFPMPKITPKFDPDVPVGFIVGTDSNTFKMSENESVTRGIINAASGTLRAVQIYHSVIAATDPPFTLGSLTYAYDAEKAANYLGNIDNELNIIKGSSANDGLLAVDGQYIPKDSLPNFSLASERRGYYEVHQVHNKIMQEGAGTDAYGNPIHAFLEADRMVNRGAEHKGR